MSDSPLNSGGYVAYHDETVIWSGSPSQWVNFQKYFWWFCIGAIGCAPLVYWYGFGGQDQLPKLGPVVIIFSGLVMGWSALIILYHWIKLRCNHVSITQNKITIATGFTALFRSEKYCELSDVIDVEAPAPGLMGLLGLGSLVLRTNDSDQPEITIMALRNRVELRDALMPLIRRLRVERNSNVLLRRQEG